MTYIIRRRRLGNTSTREIASRSTTGITVVRNDAVLPTDEQLCIRWGCTSTVPQRNVVNTAAAIHRVSDKRGFRQVLQDSNLCPRTWFDVRELGITYPCVVRPRHHHQGRNLHVCNGFVELLSAAQRSGNGYYISELIDKVREYRVFVAQGRVVCVANKIPSDPSAIAWNVARGGTFENVRWDHWPLQALDIAIAGHELSGLDFSGVDIMEGTDGTFTIVEINSAPSLTSEYRQTCFAKVFDYMSEHGKDALPLNTSYDGWRRHIHPAIWPRQNRG